MSMHDSTIIEPYVDFIYPIHVEGFTLIRYTSCWIFDLIGFFSSMYGYYVDDQRLPVTSSLKIASINKIVYYIWSHITIVYALNCTLQILDLLSRAQCSLRQSNTHWLIAIILTSHSIHFNVLWDISLITFR